MGENYYCPTCEHVAKTRCLAQRHIAICATCHRTWPLSSDPECPHCRDSREKAERRLAKEAAKDEKRKQDKGGKK
ncbi:hypothetical protein F4802DRAFT_599549 [Xylaria palmicola]|nr:hypothetical protein F4802DRAFT_599549 [Xylaria palmicola]